MLERLHEDLLLGRQQLIELDLEGLVVAKLDIAPSCGLWRMA